MILFKNPSSGSISTKQSLSHKAFCVSINAEKEGTIWIRNIY